MTGRQLKAFAAQVPDSDCIVEVNMRAISNAFRGSFDDWRYSTKDGAHWVPVPVAPLRAVVTPEVVQAARVAERLADTTSDTPAVEVGQ